MQKHNPLLAASLLAYHSINASATVRYVDLNSASPTSPYTNWTEAATNIQDAVDVAAAGDQILVTNGVYQTGGRVVNEALTNRVAVTKPITVQSVNGPQVTVIKGYPISGDSAVRCVYLTNAAVLTGFTLTNGTTRTSGDPVQAQCGGAVWCESLSAILSNCVLSGNSAYNAGGGAYAGTLNNCVISGNSAAGGGGAYLGTLNQCTLNGNAAFDGGGATGSTLNNCKLTGNRGHWYGGGASYSTLDNCLLASNTVSTLGGAASECRLNNCTVLGNSSMELGSGVSRSTLYNCIVYYNGGNHFESTLNYCCTEPIPDSGVGNFTNAPFFVDQAGGNLHLQSSSPCINSGYNGYAPAGSDLDGNPRVVGGTVDVGAYEFQSPTSVISYAWLQDYGLATDGSADYSDPDADQFNNSQEWIAGTNPTDSLSMLRLLKPTNGVSGVNVSWESVKGRSYWLEWGTQFGGLPPFSLLSSNITGQAGMTSYTDTNAVGDGSFFYRVGVHR